MDPEKPFMDDPDAPPSAEEIAEAERLRDALADPARVHEGATLARAVALAHEPRAIDPGEHQAIVERAIAAATKGKRATGGRVIRVVFGVAAALSAAAALLLVIGRSAERSARPEMPATALAPVRSTQPLFHEPFARIGGASDRIDRIAMARAGDLRDNRFALWGVR
jgi:hypothetical protein